MDLKIKDVADLLNVSETTIRRWLADKKIPAYKINHSYRFSRMEIEDWVLSQKLDKENEVGPFTEQGKSDIDNYKKNNPRGGHQQFSLYRAIHKGGVLHNIPGDTKEEVIRSTVKMIAKNLDIDRDVITELLLDRENLQSTGLNNGVALPHTRDCIINARQDYVTVVFPEKPIAYGALDGNPVHTLFFLFSSNDKRHLHILAKIAHLSSQADIQRLLLQKPSKEELLERIKEWESSIHKVQE